MLTRAGGITNGLDMVAVYIKKRWPGTLGETVVAMADVVPRPQEYDRGKVGWTAWFVFVIFKAWARGLMKNKKSA